MFKNIYVIIATFNGAKWIEKCLESCKNFKVVVVDNMSSDETVSLIKSKFQDVTILAQSENFGFGKANNIGIRYALDKGASHVFLLNQDAYLCDDVLDRLVDLQNKNSEYGILSPIHLSSCKTDLDAKFMDYISYTNCKHLHIDLLLNNRLKDIYDVGFVNAAAWLISKDCLETVGGFDPLFYHYGEDDNYCQRLRYHGIKLGVVPNCYIIHDRENTNRNKVQPFSQAYYDKKLKGYKINFANVNNLDNEFNYSNTKKTLLKMTIKMILFLKLGKAASWFKEYKIFKNNGSAMFYSLKKNRTKGEHYL